MAFEVIELGDPRWQATLEAAPGPEVFYRPEYCRFRSAAGPHRAVMLRYEADAGLVFDVALLKQVSQLPFYTQLQGHSEASPVDLASPEYNGPLVAAAQREAPELLRRYRQAVDGYCRESGIVTEFVRFHPLENRAAQLSGIEQLAPASDVVYVDLSAGYEQAWARYRPEHRAAIRKALRRGAEVRFAEPTENAVARFAALYLETMHRKPDVKGYYLYSQSYFAELFRHLGPSALLVESWAADSLASSTLSLLGPRHIWYLYGGSRLEGLATGANKLLFDRLIAWGAERGYQALVLCGGFAPGDGLYQFKHGFSKLQAPVIHLRKVHDAATLERLQQAKAAHDREQGRHTRLDYFPSYWLD